MKVELKNGNFFIDGKKVDMIIFTDNTTTRFPIEDDNEIVIESSVSENTSAIFGNQNTVVQGKNIVHGSVINCKGDFRLGDG
jgi:hypothetical protein